MQFPNIAAGRARMLRHARFVIASLLVAVPLGCGGSGLTLHPDGGTAGAGGGGTDAGGSGGIRVNFDGGGFTGNGTGNGGTTITGTGGTGVVDAGAPMPTGSLVFQGNLAALLNNGPPCTFEEGATGDRWCAFFTQLGTYPADLYVVNVSKAAAGTSITCGTTDANCLHLTSSFTQEPSTATTIYHPALFQGDTLVYYDATWTPYAWRPGMTAGRALAVADPTTMDVQFCTPSRKGTAVYCFRPLPAAMQTNANIFQVDLLAGPVAAAREGRDDDRVQLVRRDRRLPLRGRVPGSGDRRHRLVRPRDPDRAGDLEDADAGQRRQPRHRRVGRQHLARIAGRRPLVLAERRQRDDRGGDAAVGAVSRRHHAGHRPRQHGPV